MNWFNSRPAAAPAPPPPPPTPLYRIIRSTDVEEVLATVPKWQLDNRLLSRVNGTSQGAAMRADAIGIVSNRLMGAVHSSGGVPANYVSIGIDLADRPSRRFGGRPLAMDDVLLGYSGAEVDYLLAPSFYGLSFHLPAAPIELALAQRAEQTTSLDFYRAVRVASLRGDGAADLWGLFARLGQVLHSGQSAIDEATTPFLAAEMLDAIVSMFELHNAAGLGDRRLQWHHRRPIAQRAREFMQANLGEPITLGDVCAAARASQRTVEYAFRDVYGIGAKKFLKLLRLNEVRRRLRARDNQPASIADTAHRAGFWHMGHFASDYRRLFGETASQTLARL